MIERRGPSGPKATKTQLVLAGFGVVFCVVFAGKLIWTTVCAPEQRGPSDLARNPDKQDEVLAWREAEKVQDKLKLSDSQTERVANILFKNGGGRPPMPPGRPDEGMDPSMFMRFREQREAMDREIAAVLSAKQAEAFENINRERREERRDRFGSMFKERFAERFSQLGQELELTEDQQEALQDIIANLDIQPPDPFRDGPRGPQAMMERMQTTRDSLNTQISAILTPEQKAKFEEWSKQQGPAMDAPFGRFRSGQGFGPGGGPRPGDRRPF